MNNADSKITVSDAYYVKLYDGFQDLTLNTDVDVIGKNDSDKDTYYTGFFSYDNNGWRIYNGTTPILNAFLPNAEQYFGKLSDEELSGLGIADDGIQYGTAANPLLTIINANEKGNVKLDWDALESSGNASFAVYGGGLTLKNFGTETGYYRGTIYADGALNVEGTADRNFNLGSSANLYGTSVKLDAKDGDATIYGNVTSTNGGISIKGDDVEIIGKLAASKAGDDAVSVKNIAKQMPTGMTGPVAGLDDPKAAVPTVSDAYAHKANNGNVATETGSITVNASGVAEVLYGNLGTGSVSTAGNFTVNGGAQEDGTLSGGSVYVDSDLSGTTGDINLSAGGEVLLDITNIAKANSNEQVDNGKDALHEFLANYKEDGDKKITLDSANDDEIIAIDMWNDGKFDLDKYNDGDKTFGGAIQALGKDLAGKTHIWISDAEQLKGIQNYAETNGGSGILGYNFALKGNIDASELEGYKAIGGDKAYSGIFGKLAGTVKDLRVYASKFFGDGESAGAIASEVITQTKEDGSTVSGTITGVTTFGNTVTAEDGAAGGIAGKNSGSILESTASDSVTASGANAYAGGIAGVNTGSIGEEGEAGESAQITADSAVRSGTDGAAAIGGVVGKNENGGKVWLANSLGVTTGANAKSTGGIAGTNSGTMTSLYNESIVTGGSSVGGVAGDNSGTMENAVNATGITATGENAGGIAGTNRGEITSGRNAGTINGTDYVGGMVGKNEKKEDGTGGILQNLSNAIVAAITGKNYVGGIAGSNAGSITSANDLTNEGTVSGTQYVGGIAGENTGTIENVLNETLVLKTEDGTNAMYFGGIAGTNSGTITNATNNSNVRADGADGATFVGGIVGQNTTGTLVGELTNNGDVSGASNVGGLAGLNGKEGLLHGTVNDDGTIRLKVTNTGKVSAENGSAGGIFYANTGSIENADLVNEGEVIGKGDGATGGLFGTNSGNITNSTLTNTGTVTGNGVTGGLIGENSGAVTDGSKLTNSGTVKGGDNTGGLIGKNSGDVSFSSLINEYSAEVTGGNNTGGLIGYNTGTIKGGRGEDNDGTMYTDKIYNNGTVSGASNVGGLIGNNAKEHDKTGSLTAGYNTGVVDVTGDGSGENVGGIAGTNAGTIDQVFNTIMTGVDNLGATLFGAVTGKNNVGGIIGSNTGKLTNAYNTTGVTGTTNNIGNIVGKNTDTVENVYATNETGTLVGDGDAKGSYSFSEADNKKEGITVIKQADKNKQDSYMQFDFTGDSGNPAVWKIYEGKNGQEANGTPLLKVFLTNAEYSGETSFTYNGKNQGLSLDGVTVDREKLSDVAKTLLSALEGKNAYNGYLGFTSEQIAGSTTKDGDGNVVFNPNNLGYDIAATFDINKAQLSVTLDEISREYGNGQIKNDNATTAGGHYYNNGYGYTVTADNLTQEMIDELSGEGFYTFVRDGAVDGVSGQKKTNDVDSYTWSAAFKLGELAQNYKFADSGDDTLTVDNGVSKVTPATLTIQLDNVNHTYGDISKPQYSIKDDGNLVNGDAGKLFFNAEAYEAVPGDNETYGDGALYTVNGDTRTKDVGGTYYWNVAEQDYAKVFGGINTNNYNITVIKGESNVTPKELSISSVLATIMYGNQNNEGFKVNVGNLVGFAEGYGDEEQVKLDSAYFNNTSKGTFSTEYINSQSNRVTADAGTYENGITYSGLSGLGLLTGDKAKNYVLADSATGNVEVMKANLNITFNDIWREYGDTAIRDNGSYGYTQTGLVNMDDANIMFNADAASGADGGIIEVDGKQRTNDAGTYNYVNVNDENSVKGLFNNVNFNNYTLKEVSGGNSKVTPKTLSVSDILATIVYGNQNGKGFEVDADNIKLTGFAEGYGDEDYVDLNRSYFGDTANGTFSEAYTNNQNGRITADAGTYENGITYSGLSGLGLLTDDKAKNYVLADSATGNVEVMKANLNITFNDIWREYGDTAIHDNGSYGSTQTGLVNMDDVNIVFNESAASGADGGIIGVDGKQRTNDAGAYNYVDVNDENSVKGLFNNVNFNNYTLKEVSGGNSKVTPKTLSVSDILATIVYGNQNGKGFEVNVDEIKLTGFAEDYGDEDYVDLNRSYFGDTANGTFSEEYTNSQNGRLTADAGTYENGITYSGLSGLGLLTGNKAKNYVLADSATGNVNVMKADLIVTPNAVSRGYGDLKADYTFSATSLVNDDENYSLTLDETMISDTALVDNKTKTDNVGGYKWTFVKEALGGVENLLRNYDVTVGEADSTVTKADLTIKADDQNMLIGTTPNFTGTTLTELANQLVNGDSLPDGFGYLFGVGDEAIFSEVGTHADAIGLFYNGAFYGGGLTGWGGVFANYNVNFVPGTLTVVPPSTDNYGHLHSDGWERVRNFRERKAEVFFHEGGMEYDEDM